jgi:hypothetical protein
MSEYFDIELVYKGEEIVFHAEFMQTAYSYRIKVRVGENELYYEPDEERNFRATTSYDDVITGKSPDKALLAAIANALILLFKD